MCRVHGSEALAISPGGAAELTQACAAPGARNTSSAVAEETRRAVGTRAQLVALGQADPEDLTPEETLA